jgi:hypothetical protein
MNRCFYIVLLCIGAFINSYAGEATLRHFTIDDGLPSNSVYNNGVRTSSTSKDTAHKSFALKNIGERIEKLGIIQNKKITFEIYEESGEATWTVVLLRIPLL